MSDGTPVPKYEAVKQALLDMIRGQDLQPGDQIISLAEIMSRYGVSKVTAVRALVELESEGIVSREQGRGTFVSDGANAPGSSSASPAVAVLLPTFTNPFYAELLAGIESTLSRAGLTAEVASTDFDVEREYETLGKIVRERRCKGVIVAPWTDDSHRFEEFLGQIPMVFVDYCPPAIMTQCRLVRGDNFRGAYEAALHLIELGHKRIGQLRWKYSDHDRYEGFCAAMRENAIDDDPPSMLLSGGTIPVEELLEFISAHSLSGLMVVNDMLAIQALHILRQNGLRVPHDISVVGYDDIEAAKYLDVPLTTISQHDFDIGRRAGQWMQELLRRDGQRTQAAEEILFTPSLIVRQSTAPPAVTNTRRATPSEPLAKGGAQRRSRTSIKK